MEVTAGTSTPYVFLDGHGEEGGCAGRNDKDCKRLLRKTIMKDNQFSSRILQGICRGDARNLEVQGLFWERENQ